jgi:hypothetical protein
MREFPLLDLHSAWRDALQTLGEIEDMADLLYANSDKSWMDMWLIRTQVLNARKALGTLPRAILAEIATDEVALAEMEDRADARNAAPRWATT